MTNAAPRKNSTVKVGRSTFRVTGSERQGAEILVRLTRLTGRGARNIIANSRDCKDI